GRVSHMHPNQNEVDHLAARTECPVDACLGHVAWTALLQRWRAHSLLKPVMALLMCLVAWQGCSTDRPESKRAEQPAAAVKVRAAKAIQGQRSTIQYLPGTVRAVRSAPLASKLTGTILEVRVHSGERVKAGQLLASIDSREAEAMIQKAAAGKSE